MNLNSRFKIEYNDTQRNYDEYLSANYLNNNNIVFNTNRKSSPANMNKLFYQKQLQLKIQREKFYAKVLEAYQNNIKEKETNDDSNNYSNNDETNDDSHKRNDEEEIELPIINLLAEEEMLEDTWENQSINSNDTEKDILNNITEVVVQDKIL